MLRPQGAPASILRPNTENLRLARQVEPSPGLIIKLANSFVGQSGFSILYRRAELRSVPWLEIELLAIGTLCPEDAQT